MPKITAQKPPKAPVTTAPVANGGLANFPSAWDLLDRLSCIIYGPSGSGKTSLAATFPGPILWLVCSGGKKPGELLSINTPEYRKKIDARIVNSVADMEKLISLSKGFATVVLDHATGFRDLTLQEILGLEQLPAIKGWGMATRDQYGQSGRQCIEVFRTLLGVSANVVIIAQEKKLDEEELTKDMGGPIIWPDLPKSVRLWLTPAVDYVFQTYNRAETRDIEEKSSSGVTTITEKTGKIQFCLGLNKHETHYRKFRNPRRQDMPDLVNPTYDMIAKAIKG